MNLWVWGVDVCSCGLDIAATRDGETVFRTARTKKSVGAQRLRELRELAMQTTWELAATAPPLVVGVERPAGRYPLPTLMAAWGVVSEALYAALRPAYALGLDHQTEVVWFSPTDWKKLAGLPGNATKTQIAQMARGLTSQRDLSQDSLDALMIARATSASMS